MKKQNCIQGRYKYEVSDNEIPRKYAGQGENMKVRTMRKNPERV